MVQRSSFGENTVSPPRLRQPRKYARVAIEKSEVKDAEAVKVDAGLGLGRSFRCSWAPDGTLIHFGKVCAPTTSLYVFEISAKERRNNHAFSSPSTESTIFIEKIDLLSEEPKIESRKASRLLNLHMENTQIDTLDSVPYAGISSEIRFSDFCQLFENGDRSHEASVWRLGQALFDEIDLRLPMDASDDLVVRISELRRKLALSKWLEQAVSSSVDQDLLKNDTQPSKIFTLLSGHQNERAVETALSGNDMRLSTLLSQIGGPETFKEEVYRQLEDWKKYKVNPYISTGYRKLYALLAGITDISPGDPDGKGVEKCSDVLIAEDLDWKRCFGLEMWYKNSFDQTIGQAFESYTTALDSRPPPAEPLPPYLEKPSSTVKPWKTPKQPTDILYNMIKMFSDITVPLDDVLRSKDCSPSPMDMRMCWHLYILLSRVLGKRDFRDRDEEGYSASADSITVGYAVQLEDGGDWRLAAFVLLHLETSDG